MWKDLAEIREQWTLDNFYEPEMEEKQRQKLLHGWHKAVGRSLDWAEPDEE